MTDHLILRQDVTSSRNRIIGATNIEEFQLFEPGTMVNSNSHSRTQMLHGKATVQTFLKSHQGRSVVVFTDGSVINGPYGAGACASLLLPLKDEELITQSIAVGSHVQNVECELTGIILVMEMILQYFVKMGPERKLNERVYILCNCESAIKIIVNRNEERYHSEKFKLLDDTIAKHACVCEYWMDSRSFRHILQ